MTLEHINQELQTLKEKKNYRSLPPLIHEGRDVLSFNTCINYWIITS